MISRGGVFDKIGNWYEQSLVMFQWLRLLGEHITQVNWEPMGEQGLGVDYQIHERDLVVAVQCKTNGTKSWSPSELAGPLAYARQQLEGGADRYRFISNLRPTELAAAAEAARCLGDAGQWLAENKQVHSKYVTALGYDPDNVEQLTAAWELFRRIQVQARDQETLNECIREEAKLLAGKDHERLLLLLYERSNPQSLGHKWTASDLYRLIDERGIQLLDRWSSISSVAWMRNITNSFVDQAAASRRGRPEVPRAEVARLTELGLNGRGVILAHGQPGTGKSIALAQTVIALGERGIPVLALRADQFSSHDLGENPIGRFRSLLGERGGCLVVDQLDQAAAANAEVIPAITKLVQAAVRVGITVIIGCRSVDAKHETGLHQILYNYGSPPEEVVIADYEVSVVAAALQPFGIPIDDLGADLLALVRNPLALALFMDVIEGGESWRAGSSTVELVDEWCRKVGREYGPDFNPLLDDIAQAMEQDRVLSVDRHLLDPKYASIISRLLNDGLLIEDGAGKVRIFHQVISDMRIALTWSKVKDTADFLNLLGSRQDQGLRHARRARLTVQRLANRGATGTAILRDLVWHSEIREIVRRSLLLGLADLTTIQQPIVQLVIDWLAMSKRRSSILGTVVRGQIAWTDALDDWFDQAWTSWPEDQRGLLLECCSSVASRRGDFVARHLARWEKETPGTLSQAQWAFWHDPSEDSDEQFNLRLEHLVSSRAEVYHCDWSKLIASHPLRAARLLAAMVEQVSIKDLTDAVHTDWMYSFPEANEFPESCRRHGADIVDCLKRWWLQLEFEDLRQIGGAILPEERTPLDQIVEFMGYCLGSAISLQQKTWKEAVASLSDSLRPLDAWLLLRAGHYLDPQQAPLEAFSAAAAWIRSDPQWVQTEVGFDGRSLLLAAGFLNTIAPQLDAEGYDQLEQWLIGYADPWTTKEEAYRWESFKKYGNSRPSRCGATAYLLLPALGQNRWASKTRKTYDVLERKFRGHQTMFERSTGKSGWVRSKVRDTAADLYSIDKWIKHIRDAPESDWKWSEPSKDTVGQHTKATNICQLRELAEQRPQHYRHLAAVLPEYQDRLPDETFSALVGALGRTTRPDRADVDWQPLDDQAFADIFSHTAYLHCAACARELAMAIQRRASFPWSDQVVDRLVEIAHSGDECYEGRESSNDRQLLSYRINDAACIALNALAAIAGHHSHRQIQLLPIAEALVEHADIGRRACAAMLAWQCHTVDQGRAARVALTAANESQVAAQHDMHSLLRWLVYSAEVDGEISSRAQGIMLGLLDYQDSPRAEWGGIGALCLWAWDRIDFHRLKDLLNNNVIARRAAAKTLASWLGNQDVIEKCKSYALEMANDDDEQVGNHILWVFRRDKITHLLQDDVFIIEMAQSAAVQRNSDHLIKACDRHGQLLQLSQVIITVAEAVIGPATSSGNPWQQQRNAEASAGLLVRLVQEADQQGKHSIVHRALDVLDQIIAQGVIGSGKTWQLVTSAADG